MGDTNTKDYLTIQESFDYLANKIGINRDNINALATTHIYTTTDIENFLTINNYIDIVRGDLRYQLKGEYYTKQEIWNNYYTKTDIDFMLYGGTTESSLSNYYTKNEIDAKIPTLPDPDFPDIFGTRGEEYIWGFNDDQVQGSQTTVAWAFGQIVLTDTKIVTNQTSFNNNELVTKLYVDTKEDFGNTNWTEGDEKGKIIHGNKSVTFEELIKVIENSLIKKIIFIVTDTLTTNTSTHKVSQWQDIQDLTIDGNYKYISKTKLGTKHELQNLTTTSIIIYQYDNETSDTIGNPTILYKWEIRKNANNNNVQFRYNYKNNNGNITIPTTITLYLFL